MCPRKISEHIFAQMEAFMFVFLQKFFDSTRSFQNWGKFSDISNSFSWGIFGHVTCLVKWAMLNVNVNNKEHVIRTIFMKLIMELSRSIL